MTSVDLITTDTGSPCLRPRSSTASTVIIEVSSVAAADVDPHLGRDGAFLDLDDLALDQVARAELHRIPSRCVIPGVLGAAAAAVKGRCSARCRGRATS